MMKMFNDSLQIMSILLTCVGIFLQTVFLRNPFNPKSVRKQIQLSLNTVLNNLILAGGVVVAADFLFKSVILSSLETTVYSTRILIIEVVSLNLIFFISKKLYPVIVKQKNEEDFLTRFLTKGQRRNNPFDFSNPSDMEKAVYTINSIIRPSLTAILYMVICVVVIVAFLLIRSFYL